MMSATFHGLLRPLTHRIELLSEKVDTLTAELCKLATQVAAIQQRLDEQRAAKESDIGQIKPRRGRPPSKRRD